MMAYGNGYALCVLHDGSPVREIHGKVSIPFYSEYKVRLKNKHHSLRAKARVWIDGRKVSNLGDFILHPGETLDLERFLDCDMDTGNRFKFVPLSDSRVNDPTDPENGIIKVEFYREQSFTIDWTKWVPPIKIDPPPKYPWDGGPYYPSTGDVVITDRPTWIGGGTCDVYTHTSRNAIKSSGATNDWCNVNYVHCGAPVSDGATVEGGISNQRFVEGADFLTEVSPTVLTLKITSTKRKVEVAPYKPNKSNRTRYCPGCGRRRQRRTDKFCPRCGSKY